MERILSVEQGADLHGPPVNVTPEGTRPPPSASADSSATTPPMYEPGSKRTQK